MERKQTPNKVITIPFDIKVIIGFIFLMIFFLIIALFSVTSSYKSGKANLVQEIKNDPDWDIKVVFCEEKGLKYYRDSCWQRLGYMAGGYRYPILVSQGQWYFGTKEYVYAGYFPDVVK